VDSDEEAVYGLLKKIKVKRKFRKILVFSILLCNFAP